MNNKNLQQDSLAKQQMQSYVAKKAEIDLSIEVVLLIVGGVFFFLFGVLLFLIDKGMLPYSEGSMYGLFVVLVSIQIITIGRTPFGDVLRSWLVVIMGLLTAMLGTLAIFYPEHLNMTIRTLAGLLVLITGAVGLRQLFTSDDKARKWMKVPGILQQLTIACALVYSIEIALGIITLFPGILPSYLTAVLLLLFGSSVIFLAWCIHVAAHRYSSPSTKILGPSQPKGGFILLREASLTVENTFSIYQGFLMILLGILVLAMILGPQLEASLRRSLIYSHGDLIIFFERPIAATLMALALLMLLSPIFRWVPGRKLLDVAGSAPQGSPGDKSNIASE